MRRISVFSCSLLHNIFNFYIIVLQSIAVLYLLVLNRLIFSLQFTDSLPDTALSSHFIFSKLFSFKITFLKMVVLSLRGFQMLRFYVVIVRIYTAPFQKRWSTTRELQLTLDTFAFPSAHPLSMLLLGSCHHMQPISHKNSYFDQCWKEMSYVY